MQSGGRRLPDSIGDFRGVRITALAYCFVGLSYLAFYSSVRFTIMRKFKDPSPQYPKDKIAKFRVVTTDKET